MFSRSLLVAVLIFPVVTIARADQFPDPPVEKESVQPPSVDVVGLGLQARFDSAANPVPPRRGYKVGQRIVFTIWVDNDDPYDGMRNISIRMPRLPENWRLDLSRSQPAYGNIFVDSRFPSQISDTPINCRILYVTKREGDKRRLTPDDDSSNIRDVVWIISRGNSEQVVGPHNANDDIWHGEAADTRFGAAVDADNLYVRYAVVVVDKPAKKK